MGTPVPAGLAEPRGEQMPPWALRHVAVAARGDVQRVPVSPTLVPSPTLSPVAAGTRCKELGFWGTPSSSPGCTPAASRLSRMRPRCAPRLRARATGLRSLRQTGFP